ncbi:GspE/PulE family protein [Futiania mangrovi]|uniref:GspE/PulE family protein n=1 Tax=Futiania mangrovi TaxID=2959716 RepID=A0A9J6PP62_9PROT|nr:GspE/PulE family protein [Futiania mangrovii]MCP1337882.1 GspE/PulE family protein [Futiania mangrovii]
MQRADPRAEAVANILKERGVVDAAAIDRARLAAEAEGLRLDHALARLGLAPEAELATAYAHMLGEDLVALTEYPDVPVEGIDLPLSYMERARVLPLALQPDALVVAMADPLDTGHRRAIELKTGRKVAARAARPADIDAALRRLYNPNGGPAPAEADLGDVEKLRSIASDAPVVRFVDRMLAQAVERRASDVHLLPSGGGLRVRMRIDGHLQDTPSPPAGLRAAILSRLKLMGRLDIAETRLPQDGRIRLVIRGRELDLRISVAPTVDGESMVVRILDGGGDRPELERLGLSRQALDRLAVLLDRPHGVTVVTGPTGSGKTTTLYAALRRISRPDLHIATIEDPVEYRLEGVNQIQVRPDIGFDFPEALRQLLRHDPDVVMIGEIRDSQTARIGFQSALTGHPVLATLHTNDAVGAIPRLIDMGVEPFLIAAVLNGVVAQRLVRRLCPSCRRPVAPPPAAADLAATLGIRLEQVHAPVGCATCRDTGYDGRTAIAEVLEVDEAMRAAIRSGGDTDDVRRAAGERGMVPLMADALAKAAAGETSLDEIARVVGRIGT